jgi:hypothetical protein
VVDQHQVGIDRRHGARDFLELAFADERGRIRTVAILNEFAGNFRAGGSYQLAEFGKRFFNPRAGDTTAFRSIRGNVARDDGAGRQFKIAV